MIDETHDPSRTSWVAGADGHPDFPVQNLPLGIFSPGGASLHNRMNGHGPDQASYDKAVAADLKPVKIDGTMAFMFETRHVVRPTEWAMTSPTMQLDYDDVWTGFPKAQLPK